MALADESLIRQATQRATGATIHDVNGIIACLRCSLECLERTETHDPHRQRDSAMRLRHWSATILEEFVNSGDIKAAKKWHPIQELSG